MKFRLIRGVHQEGGQTYSSGVDGQDIIETDKDLSAMNDSVRPRFLVIEEFAAVTQQTGYDILRVKTVKELRELAEEETIDLGDAMLKDDIVNIIHGEMQLA